MLNSMPVIGYMSGATPEIIADEDTGILYDDINGLKEAMKRLIKDAALREKMGNAGYERAVKCFTAADNIAAVEQLFDDMEKEQ